MQKLYGSSAFSSTFTQNCRLETRPGTRILEKNLPFFLLVKTQFPLPHSSKRAPDVARNPSDFIFSRLLGSFLSLQRLSAKFTHFCHFSYYCPNRIPIFIKPPRSPPPLSFAPAPGGISHAVCCLSLPLASV